MTKNRPARNQCKYMRTRWNWTPNDYDLRFPIEEIPENIPTEDTTNLTLRLQKKFPLTKNIHLYLNEDNRTLKNTITTHTQLYITTNNTTKEVKIL